MRTKGYRDLLVWQKSVDFCEQVYLLTATFPDREIYGLSNQLRRAAVSVPSNIAEGTGRITSGEFVQSVGHARVSVFEIETQLLLAERLKYLGNEGCSELLAVTQEIGRMCNGLINSLQRSRSRTN